MQNNIKATWNNINDIMNRNKSKSNFLSHFLINGVEMSDKEAIASAFNDFSTYNRAELASTIEAPSNPNINYDHFMRNKPNCTFSFRNITEDYVKKIIESIPTKSSCGYDDVSTYLLKNIKNEIVGPLTIIINQALSKGYNSIPSKLTSAKVIPVFKISDNKLLNNHRPISLLPAFSKVLKG